MENQLIVSNKQKLKNKIIFDLINSCISIIFTMLCFFLPIFKIKREDFTIEFSIFNEVKLIINGLMDGDMMILSSGIFPLMILVGSIVILVISVVDVVKKASALVKLDDSLIKVFDEIVTQKKKGVSASFAEQTPSNVYGLVIFVIVAVVYAKFLGKLLGHTYLSLVNSVSILPVIGLVIVLVGYIVISVFSKKISSDIKKQHLQQKYKEEQIETVAIESKTAPTSQAVEMNNGEERAEENVK